MGSPSDPRPVLWAGFSGRTSPDGMDVVARPLDGSSVMRTALIDFSQDKSHGPSQADRGEEEKVLHRGGGEQGAAAGPHDRRRHRPPVPRRGGSPATARESSPENGGRPSNDLYSEELAQSQAEFETEEGKLRSYIEELRRLGVEFKGPDGLCDFYSIMDGREVFLCWRLGEPEVQYWHDLDGGFAGRQPLPARSATTAASRRI